MKFSKAQRNNYSHTYIYPNGTVVVVFEKRIKNNCINWCWVYPSFTQTSFKKIEDLYTQSLAITEYLLSLKHPIVEWCDSNTQRSLERGISLEYFNIRELGTVDLGLSFYRCPQIHSGTIMNCESVNSSFTDGDERTRGYPIDKVIQQAA